MHANHCALIAILSMEFNEAVEFREEIQGLSTPLAEAFDVTRQASPNACAGVSQTKTIGKL
jgi:hypothetical protein